MNPAQPQQNQAREPRRAVIIVAVLVVVVILSLAGYQYSDSMMSEYKASEFTHRTVQAKAFADSGILYTMAMLSNQNNFNNLLQSNPWNNAQYFQAQVVPDENGQPVGYFSIIAPADPLSGSPTDVLYGVMDEGGKINLNAMMKIDPTGTTLYNMLILLPNMTEQIACAIISWMGGSYGQTNGGAQNDYYTGLTPPYQCRNGPIDSIDELLLVQGVTRDFLYGADANRNGTQDGNEPFSVSGQASTNSFDRGWSAFLTVHSREQNYDINGNAYVFLNNTDLTQLQVALQDSGLSTEMCNFILLYRQYGPGSSTGGSQGAMSTAGAALGSNNNSNSNQNNTVQGDLTNIPGQLISQSGTNTKYFVNSIFNLVNVSVSVPGTDPNTMKANTTTYASPLNNSISQDFTTLFTVATLVDPTQNTEMPARININTAPYEVLATIPGLQDTDIQQILAVRPSLATPEGSTETFQTPAWLLLQAQLSLSTLQATVASNPGYSSTNTTGGSSSTTTTGGASSTTTTGGASSTTTTGGTTSASSTTVVGYTPPQQLTLDNLITTRTQVFRVQAVGYFEGNKGPAMRVEAVVDTNSGRPRILMWRNLTELGKGWNGTPP